MPVVVRVSRQLPEPAASVTAQLLSGVEIFTVPVGVSLVEETLTTTVTPAPLIEGSGVSDVIVVVVEPITVCGSVLVLLAWVESPWYSAVMVCTPSVVGLSRQLPEPAASVAMQPPSGMETFTVPVGVPLAEVTPTFTVTVAPLNEGSGVSDVIVVVVAATTVCCSVFAFALGRWNASPW